MSEPQDTTGPEGQNNGPNNENPQGGANPAGDPADGSLLSRTASEDEGKDNPAGDKNEEGSGEKDKPADKDDPAAQVPDKPEGYDLTFAKETQVDTALLDGFRKTALEIGLTQGQAQKLGSLYEAHMKGAAERYQEAQTRALLEARKSWEAEISRQPGFQEDLGRIQTALRQFGDRELYDLLDQTNLGSHPKMFAFMAKVGKALAEPGIHGSHTGEAKSAAEVLYPDMNH